MSGEITLRNYYDIPLHCSFCGKPNIEQGDSFGAELAGCEHLMLMTCSEGIIMAHPRLREEVKKAGYELYGDEDPSLSIRKLGSTDDEDDEDDEDIEFDEVDVIKLAQSMDDAVSFCQIVGPPSGEVSYTIFAYSEDEQE